MVGVGLGGAQDPVFDFGRDGVAEAMGGGVGRMRSQMPMMTGECLIGDTGVGG